MDYKDFERGHRGNNFWFKGKRELIDILLNKLNKKKLKILDLGAGTGEDLEILSKYGKNYVVDIDQRALDVIPKQFCYEKKKADACKLPYRENFFDVVVAFDVFEHILDDKKAAKEINRVLKENGTLIFTVPAFKFLYSSHDRALDHHRRYSKPGLKILLKDYKLIYISGWNLLLFPGIALLRLIKKNSEKNVDPFSFNKNLDKLLLAFLRTENIIIKKGISLPFGLSWVVICEKIKPFNKNE